MEMAEALRVAESMTYKPGWDIHVGEEWPGTGEMRVYVEWRADNSSPRDVDDRTWVMADQSAVIRVDMVSSVEDLQRLLLQVFLDAETHEAREFLRFDGWAPFHPHRYDGDRAYQRTRHVAS